MLLINKEDGSVITVPLIPNNGKARTYFCSNPYCKYHIDICKVRTTKMFRHKHGNNYHLCETCHNAVKLEKELQNQKHIDIIHRQ